MIENVESAPADRGPVGRMLRAIMDYQLPELGEGIYEAELLSWKVQAGDSVRRGQVLMEVMTDKATTEVPAAFAGTITELRSPPGQTVRVGDVVLTYDPHKGSNAHAPASTDSGRARVAEAAAGKSAIPSLGTLANRPLAGPGSLVGSGSSAAVKAAPSVREMARKLGVDLARVHASGPGGRILIEDVSTYVRSTTGVPSDSSGHVQPELGVAGTRVKLMGIRRKIADHMVTSKRTIPHYSYVDECDVTAVVRLRTGLKAACEKAGVKLTYLAFLVKAAAAALQEVPMVNATLDESTEEIVLHSQYHIGVAMSTPQGLVVPVVHQADRKGLFDVARDIERLSKEARSGKIRIEDLRGGTFTVTSIGNIGGLISTPIINHPEVGILGVGKVVKRPVYDTSGALRPADLVYLSFSFDHRVVDGAVGAAFANAVIHHLQNPEALLVEVK